MTRSDTACMRPWAGHGDCPECDGRCCGARPAADGGRPGLSGSSGAVQCSGHQVWRGAAGHPHLRLPHACRHCWLPCRCAPWQPVQDKIQQSVSHITSMPATMAVALQHTCLSALAYWLSFELLCRSSATCGDRGAGLLEQRRRGYTSCSCSQAQRQSH